MSTLRKLCIGAAFVATVIGAETVNTLMQDGQPQPVEYVTIPTVPVIKPEVIDPTVLTAWIDSQTLAPQHKPKRRLNPMLQRWSTSSYDTSATWPDATDATRQLPMTMQEKFACIRYHESRNHLRSVEIHSHAAGWYQFTPYIWWYATTQLKGLPTSAAQATGDQQSRVAVWFYKRNNGFYPEWATDDSACNL